MADGAKHAAALGGRRSVCGEGGDRSVTLHHGSLLRSTKQEGKVKAYKTNICGRIQSAIREIRAPLQHHKTAKSKR